MLVPDSRPGREAHRPRRTCPTKHKAAWLILVFPCVLWSPAENQDGNRQIFFKKYVSGMGGKALFEAPCIFFVGCIYHFFHAPVFFLPPLCTIYRTSAPSPLTLFGLLRSIKLRFLCNNLFFGHLIAGFNFRTVEPWQQKFLLGFM